MSADKKIVLSGLRPTGRVHLGNYWGAVKNWVDLQDAYRCHYFVADLHALTTDYADTSADPRGDARGRHRLALGRASTPRRPSSSSSPACRRRRSWRSSSG